MTGREIAAIATLVAGLVAPEPFLTLSGAAVSAERRSPCDDRELERACAAPAGLRDAGGTAAGPLVAE